MTIINEEMIQFAMFSLWRLNVDIIDTNAVVRAMINTGKVIATAIIM